MLLRGGFFFATICPLLFLWNWDPLPADKWVDPSLPREKTFEKDPPEPMGYDDIKAKLSGRRIR